ncbi:hypothetical protein HMPREF0322_04171 [Desulfitobacterium hafniense DP7]|uniref:Uncharacterized protein n=1 Tax=Desulfitobacterium hafniense DP7 TaxID=537010 RepID=G9XT65_DESHA|nr:hypothetical protein HMPREF0322_04171 [Desulfitobacterium hafniense DP7]
MLRKLRSPDRPSAKSVRFCTQSYVLQVSSSFSLGAPGVWEA